MSSTERSRECCKKVSSCAVFLFFLCLLRSCCYMCFSLLLSSLKWQLSCSWAHYLFVLNIVRLAICNCHHFLGPTCVKRIGWCRCVCN
ncbi:hypothetical protein AB205_0025260 [Aquarana catesbeiana]|uniref:Uncharacterized protein n=1 Tax=Aquarana catesbeiana TaxID=8400 RepID=A0A2G9QAD7_AQUCT|nr:hypothetical protein AB205_0025260 [Aquarana catesbeiana]